MKNKLCLSLVLDNNKMIASFAFYSACNNEKTNAYIVFAIITFIMCSAHYAAYRKQAMEKCPTQRHVDVKH